MRRWAICASIIPVTLGYDVIWSIRGLVVVSIIKNIWLVTLLYNYSEIKFSFPFIKEVLILAAPIAFSILVGGSAQYIDGLVVTTHYSAEGFAIFRYGAKELPFVVMMAAGLSSALLTEFSKKEKIKETLGLLRKKSLRIMHLMYPLSIGLLLFAKPLYKFMFSPEFTRSADVFVIYLLAIISRILFPQTILIGLKKTRTLFRISVIEVILNIFLSLWLVIEYGVVGVALATIITYIISKVILVLYNYINLGIKPGEYIPVKWYMFYSFVLITVFVLLDRGIIVIS